MVKNIVLNYPKNIKTKNTKVLINNYDTKDSQLTDEIILKPYEALAIKIKQ